MEPVGDLKGVVTRKETWLRRRGQAGSGTRAGAVRVVLLPHAGGSASFYLSWARSLPDELDVIGVQYPGREDRFAEPCPEEIGALARPVAAAVAEVAEGPLVLFGHSLGALVAYETARVLEGEHGIRPDQLFVSGRRAPSVPACGDVHRRDNDALVAELERLGGVGTELLRDPAIRSVFLPAIRADFRIAETYRHEPGPPLNCPVTALIGTDDTEVDIEQAQRWAAHTGGPFTLRTFPGGHFYLLPQQAAVLGLIARAAHTTESEAGNVNGRGGSA